MSSSTSLGRDTGYDRPLTSLINHPAVTLAKAPSVSPMPSTPSSAVSCGSPKRHVAREAGKHNNVQALYMQQANNVVLVRRRKKRDEPPMRQFMRWFVENQIGVSFNLLALLLLAHVVVPKARVYTSKFFTLGYYNATTGQYGVGGDDGYFMAFFVVFLTGLRAACIEHVFAPFAKSQGITRRKTMIRFSEQAWLLIYVAFFWSLGLYLYMTSKYWLSLEELWVGWPVRETSGLMKFYVLGQLSFWIQQILVIHIEERRKDHWQMFSHHIITIALMWTAYRSCYTRVTNVILVLMDIGDFVLAIAKCLKYTGHRTLCDIMFGVFMLVWFVCRHIFYNMVVWSAYKHAPIHCGFNYYEGPQNDLRGPFELPAHITMLQILEPMWKSDGKIFFTGSTMRWFISLLLLLQTLAIVWFTMILKVAVKVVRGDGADDTRSDDEDEGDETDAEEKYVYEVAQPFEEEVGVEAIDLKNWERRSGVKRSISHASGVSIPGHSDRKELLGRIGCEKQVD